MPYASRDEVKAAAGALADYWTATSDVSDADIDSFLTIGADELDPFLSAAGLTLPLAASSAAARSLRGLNRDQALVMAIEATFPADRGAAAARGILEAARERVRNGLSALASGKHAALAAAASDPAVATGAGSYADEVWALDPLDPSRVPVITRGMAL